MRRIIMACGLVLVLAVFCRTAVRAQQSSADKTAAAPAAMQAPTPGPEMDRLKFLIGTWDVQGEYLKTPLTGEGGKQTGWYKAQLGPGGFSIIADFEDESPLGKEIGHELFAWDPATSGYTTATVGNFPGLIVGKAQWEGDNFVTQLDFNYGRRRNSQSRRLLACRRKNFSHRGVVSDGRRAVSADVEGYRDKKITYRVNRSWPVCVEDLKSAS
jgi:hypothetical protein